MPAAIETMAYNKAEMPWHGLGVPVDDDLNPNQMMVAAGVDWEVGKFDTFIEIPGKTAEGKPTSKRVKTGQQSLIRLSDNKVLAPNVGRDWNPLQNSEAFDFFTNFCKVGDMKMETAGSIHDGEIVWALARIAEGFRLFNGDEVDSYFLFSNHHTYGQSIKCDFTPIRVVCWNTLHLALKTNSGHRVTIPHRTKFDPEKVKEMLGIASSRLGDYKESAELLGSKRAAPKDVVEYFKTIFPVASRGKSDSKKEISKHAKQAFELLETQPGHEFAEGTWWQAFNSVTYMVDHVLCKTVDQRLGEAWFGAQRDTKIKALDKALEYAKAA